MTTTPTQGTLREIVREDELCRAFRSKIDHIPDAFMLRSDERDSGLSVCFDCTPEECVATLNASYGFAILLAGGVFDLNLQVVSDAPHHANIKGIPYKEDDPPRAEFLASQLAGVVVRAQHTKRVNHR